MKLRVKYFYFISAVSIFLLLKLMSPSVLAPNAPTLSAAPSSLKSTNKINSILAEKNAAEKKEAQLFLKEGWKQVQTPPPDMALIALNESFLGEQEEKLQDQLLSATLSHSNIPAAKNLYLKSYEPKTRHLVAEALGRQHSAQAQNALADILLEAQFTSIAEKTFVITQLMPKTLSDKTALALLRLANQDPDALVQKQAIATLSVLSTHLSAGDRQALENQIPAEWLAEFKHIQQKLLQYNGKGTS